MMNDAADYDDDIMIDRHRYTLRRYLSDDQLTPVVIINADSDDRD